MKGHEECNRGPRRAVDGWRWGRWDPRRRGAVRRGAPDEASSRARAVLLVLAALAAACGPAGKAGDEARPNVVILVSDDQDYEHFSFAGHPLARTPTIDALASEGARFDLCIVPMSRCRPAQASLLTGTWPHQNGVYFNVGADHVDPETCLANRLKEQGYACYGEGKFWEYDPQLMGFENNVIRNYETFARLGQEHLFEWLRALDRDRPFFLWWAPELPHVPHDPPERLLEAIDPAAVPIPPYVEPERVEEYRRLEHLSLAMVAWLDEAIRELLDELERLGERDETLFLFVVDNGWANGLPSKGTAFDKGLRTPAVLTLPGVVPAGAVHDELVSVVDLYATVLDYTGARALSSNQGRSLRPLLEGRPFEPRAALHGAVYPHRPLELFADPARDAYALWTRTRELKYVLYLADVGPADDPAYHLQANACDYPTIRRGDEDLYDLARDPYELVDLADEPDRAEELAHLRAAVLGWWEATGGAPLPLP